MGRKYNTIQTSKVDSYSLPKILTHVTAMVNDDSIVILGWNVTNKPDGEGNRFYHSIVRYMSEVEVKN